MKKYLVIGNPIEHSLSPVMHNTAFESMKMNAEYLLRPSKLEDAEAIHRELIHGRWAGLNVTTPLKFAQTFHLMPDGASWYIHNDMFRLNYG